MTNGRPEIEYTGNYLIQPGIVESLVAEGRIPRIEETAPIKETILTLYGEKIRSYSLDRTSLKFSCLLPPEGSRPGDTVRMSALHGFLFYSPEGALRGAADWFKVTPEQAQEIRARTRVAIASKAQTIISNSVDINVTPPGCNIAPFCYNRFMPEATAEVVKQPLLTDVGVYDINPSSCDGTIKYLDFALENHIPLKALIFTVEVSGASPTRLNPLIQKYTAANIPVFLLSKHYGSEEGIQEIRYATQQGAVLAGAIPIKDRNATKVTEVAGLCPNPNQ